MPQTAMSTSRRLRASQSEERAPFNASSSIHHDPFRDDCTQPSTYGTGAGCVPSPSSPAVPRLSVSSVHVLHSPAMAPSPPATRSPEATALCMPMSSLSKRFSAWATQRESATTPRAPPPSSHQAVSPTHGRSKSDGAALSPSIQPTPAPNLSNNVNSSRRSKSDLANANGNTPRNVPSRSIVTPRGGVMSPRPSAMSPRGGAAVTTNGKANGKSPRSSKMSPRLKGAHTPRQHAGTPRISGSGIISSNSISGTGSTSGLHSAPTVPLRPRATPPPAGSARERAAAVTSPPAAASASPRPRSAEQHEPFVDHPPTVPMKLRRAVRPSSGEAADSGSPRLMKPPTTVGNYARAVARISGSGSLAATDRGGNSGVIHSRSQSSSATPCWVTDTSGTSSPGSTEEEEQKEKETKAPFFSVAPANGEFMQLIDWLLCRGERRDLGAPMTRFSDSSRSSTGMHIQQSSFFNEEFIAKLCAAATEALVREPGLLELEVGEDDTLILVGDIHGQFQDLYTSVLCQQYDRRRCNPTGRDQRFLFMGDYVDRGPHSLEVVLLLLALKVEYPSLVYLTRGNHEEEKTSRVYGFLTEATSVLGAPVGGAVWSAVNKVFLDLPLAAIVQSPHMRFFVTHGGLSPVLHKTEEIAAVNRNRYSAGDITADQDDMVTGLLWSDPTNDVPMYKRNPRGCGFLFGPTASQIFCEENHFDFICRAHQVAMEGYVWTHDERVVTVFSAPNYCGVNGNKGAVLVVNGITQKPILKQYESIEVEEEAPGPRADFPYSSMFS